MNADDEAIDRAIRLLPLHNIFRDGDVAIPVAFLLRAADWRPLKAPWWSGKEVCIIGADFSGNFFLVHCDGSVRYWDHEAKTDRVIAPSISEFVRRLDR